MDRHRFPCKVRVNYFHGIAAFKREPARKHLIKGHAKGIKVGAEIHRLVNAPCLFR